MSKDRQRKRKGKPDKTRCVEYYRLWAGSSGDSGTWDTDIQDDGTRITGDHRHG